MGWLYLANALVLLIVVWAVWDRRATFGLPWDAPFTWCLTIFGFAIALDSPWPGVAAASYPLTGKYYLLNAFGHIAFLAAELPAVKGIYMRLMPEAEYQRLLRRMVVLVGLSAIIMLTCVLVSPATSVMSARHLYLVQPDGWLVAYWVAYVATLFTVEGLNLYGLRYFHGHRDVVGVDAQIAALFIGPATTVLIVAGVLLSNIDAPLMVIWPASYLSIGVTAIVAAYMWRYRVNGFTRRRQRPPNQTADP